MNINFFGAYAQNGIGDGWAELGGTDKSGAEKKGGGGRLGRR